jgi:polyisoprenoid-binding protein YceI
MSSRRAIFLAAFLAAGALRAALPEGARLFDLKEGSVTYTVVHKLHEVTGTCRKLEGRALLLANGTARFEVRAPLAAFDSGNSNRDAHVRESTHELQHPYVTLKGTLQGLQLPLSSPVDKAVQATLELNGEKRPVELAVTLSPEGTGLRARFSFPFGLESFKIERPELLLIKVDDQVRMSGDVLFGEGR